MNSTPPPSLPPLDPSTSDPAHPSNPPLTPDSARKSSKNAPATPQLPSEEDIQAIIEHVNGAIRRLIENEAGHLIDEKISGQNFSTTRRNRVFKKVTKDTINQIQKSVDKVVEHEKKNFTSREAALKLNDETEKKLLEEVRKLVARNMEKAIADEIFEQEKVEKLYRARARKFARRLGVRHWQVLMILLFLVISFMQRVDLSIVVLAITERDKQFDWHESQIGSLLSSFYWGYLCLQIYGGNWSEKYGPKVVMTWSMIVCSAASFFMPMATVSFGYFGLWVLKFIQGVSQGPFIPASYVFAYRWIPPNEKSRLFSPAFGGMQLGTVIGFAMASIFCDGHLRWPMAFIFNALIGFLWVVIWIFIAANSPSVHRSISNEEQLYIEGSIGFGEITMKRATTSIRPWKSILTSVPFYALIICHFCANWGYYTLLTEMPHYIHSVLKWDLTENGFVSAMIYLIGWILIVVFGFTSNFIRESKKLSLFKERVLWNSLGLYGGSVPFIILAVARPTNPTIVITLLTSIMALNSGVYNGFYSNHADLSPNYVGILMGISNTFASLAPVLAPIFVGYVVTEPEKAEQWSIVFWAAAITMIIGNSLFILFGSADIQQWNTPKDLHLQLDADVRTAVHDRYRSRQVVSKLELDTEDPRYFYDYRYRNSI